MDEWLSQVYGTNSAGNDIEKTAQAMMLNKLAEEEGIDLSGLNDEELDALAQAVVAGDGGEGGQEYSEQHADAGGDAGVGGEEELQAKFAEADFLGRVMAHAYTQELQKIAQEEEEKEEKKAPPFMAAKKEEKKEEESEKTASGPLAAAIQRLGGTVGSSESYVEKIAEARAQELAIGWLTENGYLK